MFYYIPTDFIYVILLLDIIILILLLTASKIDQKVRKFSYILIILLLLPTFGLKLVSYLEPLPSYEGTLKITNNIKNFSPVYYFDNNGNLLWVFLTIKNVQTEQDFDIDGRFSGIIAMYIEGKYASKEFRYEKTQAKIELNDNELNYEKDGYITEMIERNILLIISNYFSHLITLTSIIFLIYIIIHSGLKTWKRIRDN
jgi:hypothetical protein